MLISVCALLGTLRLQSQAPTTTPSDPHKPSDAAVVPKFDVASIKPTAPDQENTMLMFTPDGISIHGVPVKMLVRETFGIEDDRIVGEPGWTKSTRFDIEAKVNAEDAPKLKALKIDQRRTMLLPLLEERFGLKYHHETRELPMYSLVVAKSGLKMKESAPDDPAAKDKPRGHMLRYDGPGHIESTGTTVEMLSHILSRELGRSIVDHTGLKGPYDYELKWTPADAPPPTAGGDSGAPKSDGEGDVSGPSLFTALEEQLGLKLESTKGQVDVVVIDHLDMPSAN
jgi:uncharacterized protein (TIGR03435 family)